VNREAELDRPSRVACSDLLAIIFNFDFSATGEIRQRYSTTKLRKAKAKTTLPGSCEQV
jgi:hypothetical protein